MRFNTAVATLVLASAATIAGAQARTIVLDACEYPAAKAARAAWRPAHESTPEVDVGGECGRGLALRCNFASNREWRVAWDRRGKWDLSEAREFEVDVHAGAAGAGMVVYFRSGERGWYRGNFHVPAGASTATLPRKDFHVEGTPAGWGRIDGIRLAVVRAGQADRLIRIAGLRAIARPARVAIYRNDAGARREPGVGRCARRTADSLDRLGIDYETVGDKAVAAGRLAGKKVAILPLNPVLPTPAAGAVRRFVAAGGKLLVCYHLPDPLGEMLGLRLGEAIDGKDGRLGAIVFQGRDDRPKVRATQRSWIARRLIPGKGTRVAGYWADAAGKVTPVPAVTRNPNGYFLAHVLTRHDPSAKDRLLLEMLGQLWRGAWKEVYARRLARLGKVAGLGGAQALSAAARANADDDPERLKKIAALLDKADVLASDAAAAMEYGDPIVSAELLGRAQGAYVRAYATSAASRAGELRAVWCHDPAGVAGMSWEKAVETLAGAGFNAIIPNMCWGGGSAYPSKVLPAVPVVGEKGDQLAQCLAAAAKHGVAVHVWRCNWRFWSNTPTDFRRRMQREGRLQQDPAGKTLGWLCPSQPENQKLEREAMLEIVRNYPVAGIHFDYIRYPGQQGCYCPRCRKKFQDDHKLQVKNWPGDVRRGELKEKYLQFRRDNITALVAAVSSEARKVRPDILLSAAVFWNWPRARDDIGQDWRLWVRRGYLDFVCPMQYTPNGDLFADWTRQTRGWVAGKAPLVPGIGATLGQSPADTLRQILIARSRSAAGFVLFNYDARLAAEHLPLLRLGATAKRTTWKPPPRPAAPAEETAP